MKTKRLLALLLAVVLVLGCLPLSAAATNYVRFAGTHTAPSVLTYGNTGVRYQLSVRVVVNADAGTAEMSFKRKIVYQSLQDLMESTDPDDLKKYERAKEFIQKNYGHLTCKASVYNKQNDAIYSYRLTDLRWDTDPFYVEGIGKDYDEIDLPSNKVDHTGIFLQGQFLRHTSSGVSSTGLSFYSTTLGLEYPDDDFQMLRDNYGFGNNKKSFFGTAATKRFVPAKMVGGDWYEKNQRGYLIDEKTYDALTKGVSSSKLAKVLAWLGEEWGGNCLGMAITSALMFQGRLNKGSFNNQGADVYDFDPPYMVPSLQSVINYYQFKGNEQVRFWVNLNDSLGRSNSLAKSLAQSMVGSKDPLRVLGFSFLNGSKRYRHAVLAYKAEELDSSSYPDKDWYDRGYRYQVYVYDPNTPRSPLYWYIKDDGSFVIYGKYTNEGFGEHYSYQSPALLSWEKPEYYLDNSISLPMLRADQVRVELVASNATITVGDKKVRIESGYVSGTTGCTAEAMTELDNDENYYMDHISTVVISGVDPTQTITVEARATSNSPASVQLETPDGFYMADHEKKVNLTIGSDGKATLTPGNATDPATLVVANDKTQGDLPVTGATAATTEMTIEPTGDGGIVSTKDGAKATVTVNGAKAGNTFEDVDTGTPVTVKNQGESTTVSNGGGQQTTGTAHRNTTWGTAPTVQEPQPKNSRLTEVTLLSSPTKTAYKAGETFSAAGMSLTARYADGTTKEITSGFTVSPSGALTAGTTSVTVSYTEGGVTQSVSVPITVKSASSLTPFVDVPAGAFYEQAVAWAVSKDPPITSGTGDGQFSPGKGCTRAQVVTFLWNAAGKPEPTTRSHPFTDVKSTAYYYKAMLWAVENHITAGLTATTFGPNATCTRAQVVTFLHRAAGLPQPASGSHPFADADPKGFYYKAMIWASQEGIAAGLTANTFGPSATCNRGQVVTFLYRADGKMDNGGGTNPGGTDNDATGYTPRGWSWVAEGEGYGATVFTSGKYVRTDGKAVIYLDSSDSPDVFGYQLFVVLKSGDQCPARIPDDTSPYENDKILAWASVEGNRAEDMNHQLFFTWNGAGTMTVTNGWIDDVGVPYDGTYRLVRELK